MFDARPAPTRRRFPAWFLALGVLLGLNLLVLLYVLLRGERVATPASPPALEAQAAPEAPAAPAAGAPPPAPATTPAGVGPTSAMRSTRIATTTTPATAAPSVATIDATPAATPRPRTRDDLLAADDAVPEVQVSLHVYDADPAKRFVFLNGQRLREGDVGADGLRVERIEADGVVLDHRGSAFKVPLEP